MNYFTGIDVGASTTKAVIIDGKKNVLGHSVKYSGADFKAAAEKSFSVVEGNVNEPVSS